MKIGLLLPRVLEALRERGNSEKEIEEMTPQTAFNEFCTWEGMPGWGPVLWQIRDNIEIAYGGQKETPYHETTDALETVGNMRVWIQDALLELLKNGPTQKAFSRLEEAKEMAEVYEEANIPF